MKKRGRSKTSQSNLIKNKYNYAFSYEELSNALNRSNYTINAFFRLFLKYFPRQAAVQSGKREDLHKNSPSRH